MKITFALSLIAFFSCITMSSGQHTSGSCKVDYCRKWHKTSSFDSLTKEKVIIRSKGKTKGVRPNSNKRVADGSYTYHYITSQYYPNGQLHIKTISKGWGSGWGGKGKTTEIIYDSSGKKISKTTKQNDSSPGF